MESPVQIEHCRQCRRETRWLLSGAQNGNRPLIRYWRCSLCGSERVQLGKGRGSVLDVGRIAEMIVAERRRSATADVETARLDYEDAEGAVREAVLAAYLSWDPARNPSLLSHATWKGRCALTDWFRDELGQYTPKALAWAISVEELSRPTEDEDEETSVVIEAPAAEATASLPAAVVHIEDEETRSTLREIALPIAMGYSHAEVAALHGQSEAWVSSRLRKLRTREDLRIPA